MQDRKKRVAELIALPCIIGGCANKASISTSDTSTASAPAAAATDHSADAHTGVALDSGWMRNVVAKNVDSLMTYYVPDAVSYGFGSAPAVGDTARRKGVPANPNLSQRLEDARRAMEAYGGNELSDSRV